MTPEGWGTNLGAIAVAGVAAWQAWAARRTAGGAATKDQLTKVGERATSAAEEAARAVRESPTANGFAGRVLASLAKLEEGQAQIRGELTRVGQRLDKHVDDHASADVRRR